MENKVWNLEEVVSQSISGFHQYRLGEPVQLYYVSDNLCRMTGYTREDLLQHGADGYGALVHPADRWRYRQWLADLGQGTQKTQTLQYQLIRKDGSLLHVQDTITVRRQGEDLVGDSVLTDLNDIQQESDRMQYLNASVPWGFLKYTCEKQPKVTYVNQKMLDLLHFVPPQEGELDSLELYKNNIFLMIPMEERRRFAIYLNRVYTAGVPIAGEMTLLRCDGTRMYVFGWVVKCVNEQGVEEFQSVCMDVTERHQRKKEKEEERYLKTLTDVYDKIFSYDLQKGTVTCLYSEEPTRFKWLEKIPMGMEDATEKFITDTVVEENKETIRTFFRDFCHKKLYQVGAKPPQITYKAHDANGNIKQYSGIFLKLDEAVSLFCCRHVPAEEEADTLRSENVSLKENMRELVMRFTDGAAAFEVTGNFVTPLYVSDNVCQFFGMTREEWVPLLEKSTPVQNLIAHSKETYETFAELIRTGEAEFRYFDLASQTQRRIRAICSQKTPDESVPRYVMLYNVNEGDSKKEESHPQVFIRTFGYFDVFVKETPIAFRSQKAKELFALLVDRRGGYVSSEEAISFLWEDEMVNSVTLSRYRKVALRLKNILEEYGISNIVESVDGKRRIVTARVQCDLYQYLSGKPEYTNLFHGSYLNNYSWGEMTLGELTGTLLLES